MSKTKVLVIGHNYVFAENRKRLYELVKTGEFQMHLLSPRWWIENTIRIPFQKETNPNLMVRAGHTIFTGHNTLCFYLGGLIKSILEFDPDILDVHEEPWSLALLQIILVKKLFKLRAKIICYSAQNIRKKFPFPFRQVEQYAFENLAYIYTCNNEIAGVLRAKGFTGGIKNIPLGIDPLLFKQKMPENLPAKPLRLGYVGRIVEAKGVFDLVDLMRLLPAQYMLTMIGSGPSFGKLKAKIAENQLSGRIKLLPGIPQEELIKLYDELELLLVPSRTTGSWKEQFGRIIVEAFARGIPVIGSDSGSIPELIGSEGLLYKEGQLEDLAQQILELNLQTPEWQLRLQKARARVENYFGWPKVAEQFSAVYKEVAKQ